MNHWQRVRIISSWSFVYVLLFACSSLGQEPEEEAVSEVEPQASPTVQEEPEAAADALDPLSTEVEAVYEDPSGLFSVPILTNWTAESADGYGILHGPDNKITVYVLAAEGDDVEAAIPEAWALADPEFGQPIADVVEPPATGGVEKFVVITYDNTADETKFAQAIGQLHDGVVYTLLFQGDPTAFQKRAAQISVIFSGFNISALEEIDLTGVEPLPLTDDLLAELEDYIVDAMERLGVPGAAVAIVQGDEVVYAQGFGVRERGKDDPVTPETLMMIGSTTKTMTTMMMATLVDEGLIEWDTPVINILPTFAVADPELTQTITMRNLVCACTGVPRRDFEIIFNYNDLSAEGIIESLADFESFTDFGEAFQYSNQMVATGGYVAALAAGGEYGDLYDDYVATMQERILTPIGMTHSTFSVEEVQTSGNYAIPHSRNLAFEYDPLPLSFEEWFRPIAPSAFLWSNVLDMGRYVITELNEGVAPDGTEVVSTKNLAITWEPQVAISSEASYGLGWIVDEYKGLRVLGHGGNTTGFTSDLAFLPEADLGISVLTNQSGSFLNQAIRFRLLELLYQQEPEYDVQVRFAIDRAQEAVAEVVEQLKDSADPDAVTPYVGRFTNKALGEITVELRDGMLILDAGEFQVELRPQVDEDGEVVVYQVVTTGVALLGFEFTEDADGNPTIVHGRGVAEYTFEKVQ